ncbi:MAG: ribosome assembly factor SBDS [Candidatus Diapherotrites archaeon]
MVKLEEAVIARLETHGEKFEVLVDPHLAIDFRHGKEVNFDELLAADSVFKDAKKGDIKSEETLKKVFGTSDVQAIAKKILLEGEVQLTTEQRREMAEKRKKEIVNFIVHNAINPQTQSPHPPQRIETALQEIKFSVDLNKSVKDEVQEAIKEIKKLIPISLENVKVAVRIPAQFSGKGNALLHKYGVKQEEWMKDGSLVAMLELPVGLKQQLFNELNNLTHGAVETKIVENK